MSSEVIPKGWLQVNIIFRVENFSKLKVAVTSEPHYLQDHEGKIFRNLAWTILVAPHLYPGTALENPALGFAFYVKSWKVGEAPESEVSPLKITKTCDFNSEFREIFIFQSNQLLYYFLEV